MARRTHTTNSEMELQGFIQRLALHLTSWQATTFLLGEYPEQEVADNPVLTVADGLFWLVQQVERNSIVRKLQIIKLRGQGSIPGLHTYRITNSGLEAFPRILGLSPVLEEARVSRRLSCGIPALDALMGGGIPAGDSMLVAGPSGTGKSLIGSNFLAAGLRQGEPGVAAIFEERPGPYMDRAESLGMSFKKPLEDGLFRLLYLRPLDLSLDETVYEIVRAVRETKAKRLVIDSLSGLEMALAPNFRDDFRESLYRMIMAVTRLGVTVVSTVEVQEALNHFPFSSYAISFLADDIVRLRYTAINGELRKMLMVVKMRSGMHSKDLRGYDITTDGIVVGDRLKGFAV